MSSPQVNPFEFSDESYMYIAVTIDLGYPSVKNFVTLACVVFTQGQCLTDRRTEGQTDGWTTRRWLIQGSAEQGSMQASMQSDADAL